MAKKATSKLPDLRNATPSMLIDELGATRDKMKELKKLEGIYKQALMSRLEVDETAVKGEKYEGFILSTSQMRLDNNALKEEFGLEWYEERCKVVEFSQVKTQKLNGGN